MIKKNLGGDRLGSGAKMDVTMHGFDRSNHDLSYLWKSTMAPGTLIPFMNILAVPGDTFDIDLDSVVRTNPTLGPLFGSFKLQLDIFQCPIRLYNSGLHNNKLGIGYNMADIKFPLMELTGETLDETSEIPLEFQQINQSSILAYLGCRGLGNTEAAHGFITKRINAIPYIAFWDCFKNYYANKQEEFCYVIHNEIPSITSAEILGDPLPATGDLINFVGVNLTPNNIQIQDSVMGWLNANEYGRFRILSPGTSLLWNAFDDWEGRTWNAARINANTAYTELTPKLEPFYLAQIDDLRDRILKQDYNDPLIIDAATSEEMFSFLLSKIGATNTMYAVCPLEGIPVKTYQSDLFNNWISTEVQEDIAAISAISTATGSFTIDTLNISKKVYDLLNRVAASGGTYQDWLEVNYAQEYNWQPETPVYCGGLSKEIIFEQVVSTAATDGEPLGSLAGQGRMSGKHKGGKVVINVKEPSYILGIVSITPRISYSQGNDWNTLLKTMDDIHKPMLDGIGFQDLITDQMAAWDTSLIEGVEQLKSAGKQPAWINYMTNYDKNYGNFADPRNQMFMTLDRRYEAKRIPLSVLTIKDLTTYIDPSKFNYAFAQTDLTAQNFWVQIASNIMARRKMSAKIIPSL